MQNLKKVKKFKITDVNQWKIIFREVLFLLKIETFVMGKKGLLSTWQFSNSRISAQNVYMNRT